MKYKNVTNLTGVDIKAKLYDAVKRGINVYEEESGRQTRFKEPLIGYANTSEPVFDMFHDNGFCKHPRKVYNAAHAVIVYFLPFTDDIVESNRTGTKPSEQWEQAYHDSTWAIMKIHASLQGELDKFGRSLSVTLRLIGITVAVALSGISRLRQMLGNGRLWSYRLHNNRSRSGRQIWRNPDRCESGT